MSMTDTPEVYPWFALQTRARYEHFAAKQLASKGYEIFLPLYHCKRRWCDRLKVLELPLFPGYLFCRFDSQDRLPILKTPGVMQIVGIARTPIPVDEEEITALQAAVRTGLPRYPSPFLTVGDRVRIEDGPLCGVEGILLNLKGRYRLVLSVSLLQRSVAVEVESAWVASIPGQAGRVAPVVCSVAAPN